MLVANVFEVPIELEDIIKIERQAYPKHIQQLQEVEDWEDVANYCDVDLDDLVVFSDGKNWYALIAQHNSTAEFVDLAKIPGSPIINWSFIIDNLRNIGIKTIEADARAPSYKKFKRIFKYLGLKIIKDKKYYDDDFEEWMHELIVKIT
jgi:hypothetical protein